ncbi:circularly permuted type 2 ATP-grasp protein [Novosphingobium sp.]|uniref:circularly permuted type 2 ATP-grasp protein n=1 Tax=Novosphingobium sp. TaxID=1874826 RepID=UPI003B51EA0B
MATAPPTIAARARLKDYPVADDALDLYRLAPAAVAARWQTMAAGLSALRDEAGIPVAEVVARQIQELGLSFRMTGDTEERPWPLSPMPLVIGAAQWREIERGLIQRAELIEAVTDDIYGAGRLVSAGHLPAALVAGSRFFARNMIRARDARGKDVRSKTSGNSRDTAPLLSVYAADLVCGPGQQTGGQWQIVSDRLRLANGIGYALENRLALSRSTGGLLSDIHVRRLAQFFAQLRSGMARACSRENPRIALLTPGRLNQSYPEQAHLARYLGFPLVEGRDLTVSDDRLYVRTIAGPKRIDALWRWIDTNALDPLAFDSRTEIGVPDGFEAWLRSGVELVNAPGAEVLEAPAFAAYLPHLCEVLRKEAPILPNTRTWWCGDPAQAEDVRDRFDDLVITSAFGRKVDGLPSTHGLAGGTLSRVSRENLHAAMLLRPFDYCAQDPVQPATTPTLIDERFAPRAFTLRAFVARGADGQWTVMPGGFARLSSSAHNHSGWLGEGDMSADVCIVDDAAPSNPPSPSALETPKVRRGGGILASQAADNLFWFARYLERAEITLRVIRAVLGSMIEVDAVAANHPETVVALLALLVERGAISEETAKLPVAQAARAALSESVLPGGVGTQFARFRAAGLTLRDRITPDFWRLVNRPLPAFESHRPGALLRVARELIERLSALSGLLAENFNRGPSWRFIDLGRRIERGLGICDTVATLAGETLGGTGESPEALGLLLDLSDSQITYRARYLTGPRRDPVCDLLLLDPDNPRSLVFQVNAICDHVAQLPTLREDMMPEAPLLEARALQAPLQSVTVEAFDGALLHDIEARLLALSDTIAARYFLQYERSRTTTGGSLLA